MTTISINKTSDLFTKIELMDGMIERKNAHIDLLKTCARIAERFVRTDSVSEIEHLRLEFASIIDTIRRFEMANHMVEK